MRKYKIKYFNRDREIIFSECFYGTYNEARSHGANRVYSDDSIWADLVEIVF